LSKRLPATVVAVGREPPSRAVGQCQLNATAPVSIPIAFERTSLASATDSPVCAAIQFRRFAGGISGGRRWADGDTAKLVQNLAAASGRKIFLVCLISSTRNALSSFDLRAALSILFPFPTKSLATFRRILHPHGKRQQKDARERHSRRHYRITEEAAEPFEYFVVAIAHTLLITGN
jgi:hypothetical protein